MISLSEFSLKKYGYTLILNQFLWLTIQKIIYILKKYMVNLFLPIIFFNFQRLI